MPTLRTLPKAWRILALGFLSLAGLGLGLAVFFAHHTAGFSQASLRARFAGPESGDVAAITTEELLQTTHTHLFTMAFLALAVGGFFLLSSAGDSLKAWIVGSTFFFILADHAGMWLSKTASPAWVWLVLAGGAGLSLALALQLAWCFCDLFRPV